MVKDRTLLPLYRVNLVEEKRKHFYDVYFDGQDSPMIRYGGVTGVLEVIAKPALIAWAKRESLSLVEIALVKQMNEPITITPAWIEQLINEAKMRPDKIKKDAATAGTDIHAIIDKLIHGETVSYPVEYAPAVNAFLSWWNSSGIELVMGDTKVASLIHKFGGSLDALGRRNGQYIILDWKTSNGIWPEYALQVSAYAQAFYETYGIYVQEGIIVRFGKKLPIEFEVKKVCNLEASFQAFLRAKELQAALRIPHLEVSNG